MKVSPLTMFSQPLQYLVPIFQRGYVWTIEKQIHLLWADIVDRAKELERYQSLLRAAPPLTSNCARPTGWWARI